jgi:hypothetical protein
MKKPCCAIVWREGEQRVLRVACFFLLVLKNSSCFEFFIHERLLLVLVDYCRMDVSSGMTKRTRKKNSHMNF